MGIVEILDLSIGIGLQVAMLILALNVIIFLKWYRANGKEENQKLSQVLFHQNTIRENISTIKDLIDQNESDLTDQRKILSDVVEGINNLESDLNSHMNVLGEIVERISGVANEIEMIRNLGELKDEIQGITKLLEQNSAEPSAPIRGRPGRKRKEIPYKEDQR